MSIPRCQARGPARHVAHARGAPPRGHRVGGEHEQRPRRPRLLGHRAVVDGARRLDVVVAAERLEPDEPAHEHHEEDHRADHPAGGTLVPPGLLRRCCGHVSILPESTVGLGVAVPRLAQSAPAWPMPRGDAVTLLALSHPCIVTFPGVCRGLQGASISPRRIRQPAGRRSGTGGVEWARRCGGCCRSCVSSATILVVSGACADLALPIGGGSGRGAPRARRSSA